MLGVLILSFLIFELTFPPIQGPQGDPGLKGEIINSQDIINFKYSLSFLKDYQNINTNIEITEPNLQLFTFEKDFSGTITFTYSSDEYTIFYVISNDMLITFVINGISYILPKNYFITFITIENKLFTQEYELL